MQEQRRARMRPRRIRIRRREERERERERKRELIEKERKREEREKQKPHLNGNHQVKSTSLQTNLDICLLNHRHPQFGFITASAAQKAARMINGKTIIDYNFPSDSIEPKTNHVLATIVYDFN